MMLKSSDNSALHPISRVSPVLSLLHIGHPAQPVTNPNAFAAHQQAEAAQSALLNIEHLPDLVQETTPTQVSAAAHLIDDVLKQAEAKGLSTRVEAKSIVTKEPTKPEVMARDLKTAIQNTGLFYESHLSQYIEGHRSLAAILQEPQNQSGMMPNVLLPQQLNVLEHQQVSWQGEIWPQQAMQWNLRLADVPERDAQAKSPSDKPMRQINSDLTLHLPRLGKVTAKLSMLDGRMQIKLFATEHETMKTMQAHGQALVDSIQQNGQILEALTVAQEKVAQDV